MKVLPYIVGLTGGIGSGKTTVANFFKELGVPIYIADDEAQKLMLESSLLKSELISLFGPKVYENGQLNKLLISESIFKDKTTLKAINNIVHPVVAIHFNKWLGLQESPYVIKEAAIFFENGSYKSLDAIITVVAPEECKIRRIMQRDIKSKKQIKAIMNNQWSDKKKIKMSDFVIENTNLKQTKLLVKEIHEKLLKKL
ncbi:MAG: dephospho-CoA kinase [Flavobacteriaceae bacterium]|jgi:dephospho-CoA kinase|nr:dephospho-CoA kinase [Bacteroidota bacterium]MDG1379074.1 dephospho-CoA kinase [Flavobacteriaceae bacterium]